MHGRRLDLLGGSDEGVGDSRWAISRSGALEQRETERGLQRRNAARAGRLIDGERLRRRERAADRATARKCLTSFRSQVIAPRVLQICSPSLPICRCRVHPLCATLAAHKWRGVRNESRDIGAAGSWAKGSSRAGLARGHEVTAIARNFASPPIAPLDIPRLRQVVCDLRDKAPLEAALADQDAMISAAGNVADEHAFIALFDCVTTAAERVLGGQRRVWMLAGALVLDMPQTRRMGAKLPFTPKRYWPHIESWRRLERSTLDWALYVPWPDEARRRPPIAGGLRLSCDAMPFEVGPGSDALSPSPFRSC